MKKAFYVLAGMIVCIDFSGLGLGDSHAFFSPPLCLGLGFRV